MDWKDILAAKVAAGELEREDSTPETTPSSAPAKPVLSVTIDRKGRKGKTATIVYGFDPDGRDDALAEEAARQLKRTLSTGGSVRGGEILIQGERLEDVKAQLVKMGYIVK